MSVEGPVLLLDTATVYFRAFHALPASLTAPDGRPHGAVRGTLDMLATLVERLRPAAVVACWDDDWRPAWRTALVASYKAHRVAADGGEDAPAALAPQVEGVVDLLAALGVPRVGADGAEADDVAATLAAQASAAGRPVAVVSGDRDLFQLVDDGDGPGGAGDAGPGEAGPGEAVQGGRRGGVRVVYIGAGVRDAPEIDAAALAARYSLGGAAATRPGGVGAAYAALALLRGDPSDGLPGVAGIGDTTAARLLTRFGDVEQVLAAARAGDTAISARQRTQLLAAHDYLQRAADVVRVRRDVPVQLPPLPAGGLRGAVDEAATASAAATWGVMAGVGRVLHAFTVADAAPTPDPDPGPTPTPTPTPTTGDHALPDRPR